MLYTEKISQKKKQTPVSALVWPFASVGTTTAFWKLNCRGSRHRCEEIWRTRLFSLLICIANAFFFALASVLGMCVCVCVCVFFDKKTPFAKTVGLGAYVFFLPLIRFLCVFFFAMHFSKFEMYYLPISVSLSIRATTSSCAVEPRKRCGE